MTLLRVLFYFLSFIAIVSALYAASSKNLVRSIFVFFVTLFSLAGLYVLALADFVAVTQVVIYVGGILVLILFAFMLSGKETLNVLQKQEGKFLSMKKLPAILLAVLFFVVLINVVFKANADNLPWVRDAISLKNEITPKDIMIDNIGVNLMTRYLLPFEAISILLLVALVGAAHLSRKEGKA
ncbi:NADH dehydrogenase subunit J [Mucilaginibacter lappiensis]|uniref:NADH-quinone oxidoreductase subunit J n=1 Tax=Mucilaginibacter lappiensis TaxID=354630 RepID=A0ABR6PLR8_9SPHI|nr:NADH-quinone oxidoreductase subunit J [Mucilaginibacter lappiensis]MBB6110680.1 NADH-quinone oxidoreductase subunit J [Mucilaginibacter lappiensis]SIR45372.1 NADH dehydrogenase subunit J [Mucilaginibacter lappiensis]